MPSEDMQSGRLVRKCEVVPTPPASEIWEYTWSDPSGRIISNNDILSVVVSTSGSFLISYRPEQNLLLMFICV